MAIVESFYNNDRARDIRELLNSNFKNVARYIPNNFVVLDTTERQNLTDDYKTHFKLVFDKEKQRVYRWSDIQRNWEQYLIYAWDEYARQEADTNTEMAFADAKVGVNLSGASAPYNITFYNRKGTAKDTISLAANNIKYDANYSVQTIIKQLLDDLSSLDSFVGDRTNITNNSDLTATTVTGAIKEINGKAIENKTKIDDILNGNTVVPKAQHAEEADHADNATNADDSNRLGGQLPSYYAKQSDLNTTNGRVTDLEGRMQIAESDIITLEDKTDITNTNLAALDTREAGHYAEQQALQIQVNSNTTNIGDLADKLDNLNSQLGWEILMA